MNERRMFRLLLSKEAAPGIVGQLISLLPPGSPRSWIATDRQVAVTAGVMGCALPAARAFLKTACGPIGTSLLFTIDDGDVLSFGHLREPLTVQVRREELRRIVDVDYGDRAFWGSILKFAYALPLGIRIQLSRAKGEWEDVDVLALKNYINGRNIL